MCPSPFSSRVLGTLERNKLKMKSKYIINLRAKMIYLWKKEKRGEMNICAYVCMYIHISCECTYKGTLTHTRDRVQSLTSSSAHHSSSPSPFLSSSPSTSPSSSSSAQLTLTHAKQPRTSPERRISQESSVLWPKLVYLQFKSSQKYVCTTHWKILNIENLEQNRTAILCPGVCPSVWPAWKRVADALCGLRLIRI